MAQHTDALKSVLEQRLGDRAREISCAHGQVTVEIDKQHLLSVCGILRDDEQLDFAQLSDLCGVDYSTYGRADWKTEAASASGFSRGVDNGAYQEVDDGERHLAVVYHLLSLSHNRRVRLRVPATGEPPVVDSVVDLWSCANWYEREAFDLFGILFDGHPDLRRILTDYGFVGHPFRKDFPLEGRVEVRYDPTKGRVVNQPTSIENRVLVPRVIRDDWPLPHVEDRRDA